MLAALVQTINTFEFSPPSPDPAGIVYLPGTDTLLISDSEVNEMKIFTGDNLFETTLSGSLINTWTTLSFSDEPTGIDVNPANGHLFISDDRGVNRIYEWDPGSDGQFETADDVITSFRTSGFGSFDPEGVAFDTQRGHLFVADGVNDRIYDISPGANGIFDGVEPIGDDQVTSFDVAALGLTDPEGIAFHPDTGHLFVIGEPVNALFEITTDGNLIQQIDISAAQPHHPAGLAVAPSSVDPNVSSIYIVDRGTDNNYDPNENDGRMYEFSLASGVRITESGDATNVTEGGALDSYDVVLDSQPQIGTTVTIAVNTADGQTTTNLASLVFDENNWSTPQTVTVMAVDDDLVEGSPHFGNITHTATSTDGNYDGIAINSVTANILDNDTSTDTILYLSLKNSATLSGGLTVENEDIVDFNGTGFGLFFDGSDVGLSSASLDAFAVISADEILMSFRSPETIPGISGTVEDSDIVKFTATGLGDTTSGTFELFLRGSDVGLSPSMEDVDAIDLHADGRLIVSTIGSFDVSGLAGGDEDLIALTPITPGDYSSGTWELYFDASDVGLASEDVDAVALDFNGNIHLSLTSAFTVAGLSGDDEDVLTFIPSQIGTNTTGTYDSVLLFDGSQFGLDANDVNAIDLPISAPAALHGSATTAVTHATSSDETGLTIESVESILSASKTLWASALGLQSLPEVRVEIADLRRGLLGTTENGLIIVDANADGTGWFVDATPLDDSEFVVGLGVTPLQAAPGSAAVDRYDLLSVIAHELGHVIGYQHFSVNGLMAAFLAPGERRRPSPVSMQLKPMSAQRVNTALAQLVQENDRLISVDAHVSAIRFDSLVERNNPLTLTTFDVVDQIFADHVDRVRDSPLDDQLAYYRDDSVIRDKSVLLDEQCRFNEVVFAKLRSAFE